MGKKNKGLEEKIIPIALIVCVLLFFAVVDYSWSKTFAMPLPHSTCGWYYIGDSIVTDCGYKITDGCPNCGRKIRISEQEAP